MLTFRGFGALRLRGAIGGADGDAHPWRTPCAPTNPMAGDRMPDVALPSPPLHAEFSIVARSFGALPTRQRWVFFGILAGCSLGAGLAVAVLGGWPVLPYSVLEIGVLAAAFWYVERRSRDWERLTVAADRVIVERERNGRSEMREFNRHWVQVALAEDGSAWPRRLRLELRFAGEAVVFGDALPQAERTRLARDLKRLLAAR